MAWTKATKKDMDLIGSIHVNLQNLHKDNKSNKDMEYAMWKDEVNCKTTLSIYRERKKEIKEE